jgi:uncharacterized protein YndB with AHSA1/START domain
MARDEATIIIGRPMEDVFDFLADLRNIPRWDSGILSVEMSDLPTMPGLTGRMVGRDPRTGGTMAMPFHVTEYERPTRMAIRSEMAQAAGTMSWTLQPVAGLEDISRLTVVMDIEFRGVARLVGAALGLLGGGDPSEQLRRLKDLLERDRD